MDSGRNSITRIRGDRIYKDIYMENIHGRQVDPYRECELLKKLSRLGVEFPQNVKCEGEYKLSYKYIPGETISRYMSKYKVMDISIAKRIAYQILIINLKLYKIGILHGDLILDNYLINGEKVYIIDFGMSKIIDKNKFNQFIYEINDDTDRSDDSDELDDLLSNLFYMFKDERLITSHTLLKLLNENLLNLDRFKIILA